MTQGQDPGARWLRCDLHVHTPFDRRKQFGENVKHAIEAFKKEKPQGLAEIAYRFVEACRKGGDGAGIDLVALTDHNSMPHNFDRRTRVGQVHFDRIHPSRRGPRPR